MQHTKTIVIILAGILATVAIVYAASPIWSNIVTINPVPPPTATLTLTANTTTPTVGEAVRFTVTLSTGASGVTVNFYVNNAATGAAVTNSGVATWEYVITSTAQLQVNATCTV